MLSTINMYGVRLGSLKTKDTCGELRLREILSDMGVENVVCDFAYPSPYGRNKFDLAVFVDGEETPRLLIEYDGRPHDDPGFYLSRGMRPCRCDVHVLRTIYSDVWKYSIAKKFNGHVLRISYHDMENETYVRWLLATYLSIYVDGDEKMPAEIGVAIICERYFPDMSYVKPSKLFKCEESYLRDRDSRNLPYISCDDAPCKRGDVCPYGLYE